MSVKSRQEERSEATRATLLATAERLFCERGYAATATEDIVEQAGVTRGALYHHFADKQALFRAVFIALEERTMTALAERAASAPDPWTALKEGTNAFLDACLTPQMQRIALVDAPSVLGWVEWREIDARYGLGLVQAALQAAMDAGFLAVQPVEVLSHLLLGALTEAAMFIARAADREAARREVGNSIDRLLAGLCTARTPAT
jgi:AcrR family transcriptional regulator